MPLWYFGAPPTEPTSPATVDYVNSLATQSLTPDAVKQEIKSRFLSGSYAKTSDATSIINSTATDQAFARQNDLNTLLSTKIASLSSGQKSRANGPVALDSTGKIDASLISGVVSTQRKAQMYWTPTTYTQRTTTTEQTICTISVSSSFSRYKVFVTGSVSAKTSVDGEWPVINVRAGNATSGQIVAVGRGVGENYKGGALSVYSTSVVTLGGGYLQPSVLSDAKYTYPIPPWCDKIDVVMVGGGGGGVDSAIASGNGGEPGSWYTATLTRGSSELPTGTLYLSGSIGQGASRIAAFSGSPGGTPTTCVTPNGVLSAGGGGTGQHNSLPAYYADGPGDKSYGGITYLGGPGVTSSGAAGNAPGGAGAGGKFAVTPINRGGDGADGAAFFYAYIQDDNNYGQISVIPTPMGSQTVLTAPTTLYVNIVRSGSASYVTTDYLNPQAQVSAVAVPC